MQVSNWLSFFSLQCVDFIASEKSNSPIRADVDETNAASALARGASLNSSSDEMGACDTLSIDSNTSGHFVSVSAGSKPIAANDGLEEIFVDKGNQFYAVWSRLLTYH